MSRARFRLLIGLGCSFAAASAQSDWELSGFGMFQPPADVVSQGLGNITGMPGGPDGILLAGPASWHRARVTRLQVAWLLRETKIGSLAPRRRVSPQHFLFLAHLNNRTAYGVSIQPITRVQVVMHDTISLIIPGDTVAYRSVQAIAGGLSRLRLGLSRAVGPRLSVGLSLDIMFGSIRQSDSLEIIDKGGRSDLAPEGGPPQGGLNRRLEFNGYTLDVHLLYRELFGWPGQLSLRAVIPLSLDAMERRSYPTPLMNERVIRHRDIGIPGQLALGYGYPLSRRQNLHVEGSFMELARGQSWNLLFNRHVRQKRSLGLAWSLRPEEGVLGAFLAAHYRVGIYVARYYLSGGSQDPLREVALTLGSGFRVIGAGHGVHWALQLGRRDSLLQVGKTGQFVRFSIGLATAGKWFNRPGKTWE